MSNANPAFVMVQVCNEYGDSLEARFPTDGKGIDEFRAGV